MMSAEGADGLRVTFWGVRGSIPTAGAEFARYGGNTACVEVRLGDRLFVIDAGSGIARLGKALLDDGTPHVDLLLSHLHLDHVVGLPFFKPALTPGRSVTIHCGNREGETAEAGLARLFSPPIFPVTLDQLPADVRHVGFRAGETLSFADGTRVDTHPLNHPQGATGYRFSHAGRTLCYLSDLEHDPAGPDPALVAFVRGADAVIYDAMFSEAEYCRCVGWGHSTWEAGTALADAAGIGQLILFHHDPRHDDAAMDAFAEAAVAARPGTVAAREGQTLVYPPA